MRRVSRRPVTAATASGVLLVAAWVVSDVLRALVLVAAWAGMAAATYGLVRPEVRAMIGAGDARPWLVRMGEHTWRDVHVPRVATLSRPAAYGLLLLAWWWLLG